MMILSGKELSPQEGNIDYTAVLPPINVNELNSEILSKR